MPKKNFAVPWMNMDGPSKIALWNPVFMEKCPAITNRMAQERMRSRPERREEEWIFI